MAKLSGGKRLTTEDFDRDDMALVQKLAFVINPFIEEIISAFSKNITITQNLNMELKDIDVTVDINGKPKTTISFKTSLGRISGMTVINHQTPVTGVVTFLQGSPYCTFKQNNDTLTITHITGLEVDKRYSIKLLIIGN